MKLKHLFATVLLAVATLTVPVHAADTVVYDAADFASLSGRTEADVMEHYTQAQAAGTTYINGDRTSYYDEPASLQDPYAAGVLSSDTLEAMKGMSNFYRWLTGVNDLTTNSESDYSLQAQALDRNFQFDHYISNDSKPDDMDDELWAEGYYCNHNILAWGYTPSGAITGWLNEGYTKSDGWDTVGHRTAIITPGYKSITYGYSGTIAIGKIGSSGNTFTNAFAAFPAAGSMPSDLISAYGTSWTVQLNTGIVKVQTAEDVVITVKNTNTGESYTCTQENNMAKIETSLLNFVQPFDYTNGTYTDSYKVTATGLYDVATGGEASITYTVDFFDLPAISSVSIPATMYEYTGSQVKPEPTVKAGSTTLTEGTDYTVTYHNNVEEGLAVVEVNGIGDYCGTRKKSFRIEVNRKEMSQCDISLSPSWNSYCGEEITPTVTAVSFGTTLTEGTDFEVSYSNNIEIGTATVTLTGIGEYSGTTTKTFTISRGTQRLSRSISSTEVELGGTATITASALEGAKVEFTSSDETVVTVDEDGTVHGVAEGTAEVTIMAPSTEHYDGFGVTVTFTVSSDYHTMEEVEVTYANGTDNVATVKRRCSCCGKEETVSFTTISKIQYVYYWTGYTGYSYINSNANEGESHEVSLGGFKPEDAEDQTIVLESSDPSIMTVDNDTFTFVGTGEVTLTIYPKYNPSVKLTKKFNVSHVLDEGTVVKESTCCEKGEKEYTCSVCNQKITEELPIDPENHTGETYVSDAVQETCGAEGYTGELRCSGCDVVLEAGSVVPATGNHKYNEGVVTKEATCTREGERTYTCSVCGDTYTETIPVNDNHDWSDVTYEWAEDNTSVTATRVCRYNNSHIETETVAATDEVVLEATEKEAGERVWTSGTFANAAFTVQTKSEPIPPFGFEVTYAWAETGEEYTVTGDGYELTMSGLSVTGTAVPYDTEADMIVETVPADFSVTVDPGCVAGGSGEWISGEFAGEQFAVQTLPVELEALGHDYVDVVTNPTCTKQGYTTHTCSRCQDSYVDSYVGVKAHTWNSGKVTKKATCTTTGVRKYTCKSCGKTRTEVIAALGHNYEDVVTEPTCTEQGYTTHTCTRCQDTYVDSYVEAKGHSWDEGRVTTEPTAEAEGERTYTCTVCGVVRTEAVPKLNDISKATVGGCSLSYGYSGKPYTPSLRVVLGSVKLTEGTDYTVSYEDNINPGTATITITGTGDYVGTKIKTFEIVDCVSTLVSGKTYQLIPKNNSSTAVCSYSGRMINNTKVYITNRSGSEAMKFRAIRNSDGTWKFINEKCELALAVQQNSRELGAQIVLYDQTSKKEQNWKMVRKSDNSFAVINSVTGYSIAMSDLSAVKGTTLSMAETESSGLQRFYLAETSAVNAEFSGTKSVRAAKNSSFGLNIASSSKTDGANVNLYKYSNVKARKFKIMYSGGGYYRLVNVNSGLVLTVKRNTKANGANVIQSKWAAKSGQRWKIIRNSDGTVTLKNALGTVLHLNGNKTANGTNVVSRNAASTSAQRWYLK